jgi:hypothetical protein
VQHVAVGFSRFYCPRLDGRDIEELAITIKTNAGAVLDCWFAPAQRFLFISLMCKGVGLQPELSQLFFWRV